MKNSRFTLAILSSLLLHACMPKPLDIQVPQTPQKIAVSSTVMDNHTLFVLASYSISSLTNLDDTAGGKNTTGISGMLIKNALVVLSSAAGSDTLTKIADGIYGSNMLRLQPFTSYNLLVKDQDNNQSVIATSTYFPSLQTDEIKPVISRTATDTMVKLHIALKEEPGSANFYLMSYNSTKQHRLTNKVNKELPVPNINTPKQLGLFSSADALNGTISKDFILDLQDDNDTIYVHTGRIEKAYYEYLVAYKRTGSLFNQLTGEPITLPTNIITGFGYFCMYNATRKILFLKDY